MCREGGCGACIVNLTLTDPVTGMDKSISVNSCLYAVYSCQGMSVTTVEGIGSRQQGYHPVQTRLAQFYGTQCGFCSPGWIMAMYSLLKSNKDMSMSEIEESFGSNNCRCTGYRSILDAFKSFADDSPPVVKEKVADIEDLLKICTKSKKPCQHSCKLHIPGGKDFKCKDEAEDNEELERHLVEIALSPRKVIVPIHGISSWYKVTRIEEIFEIFSMIKGSYMLVGGNTSQGISEDKYPPPPDTFIDINAVAELKAHRFDPLGDLVLGANMSLTDTIQLFRAVAVLRPAEFKYLSALARHMEKVAHIPVRNVGTLAGNLSFKHERPRFPSDLFTIYETVGAKLVIDGGSGEVFTVSFPEYLDTEMYKRIIRSIVFPPLDSSSYVVRTYKIMRRAQNDHAIVNAGFCFSFDKANNYKILSRPRIVYGGITPDFSHAERTELLLEGKRLMKTTTLKEAITSLDLEINPIRTLPEATNEYRKGLALSLFYRYVLSLNPSAVNLRLRSGGVDICRPLSHGIQEYYSDPVEYPLTEPIPKVESLIQCSGEIVYTNDLLPYEDELYAALVLADVARATLAAVSPDEALILPGVVAFYSAKDIPGINSFVALETPFTEEYEQLFVEVGGETQYAGQAVGMVVAVTQELANFAAARVKVTYTAGSKPVLTVQEALATGDPQRVKYRGSIQPTQQKTDVVHTITGDLKYTGQYHYYFETQTCVVRPRDNVLDVTVATQWMQGVQEGISTMLDMSVNRINVRVLRCGGAYGGKLSRCNSAACASALAAHLLQRPVRIVVTLENNMRAAVGRYHMYSQYQVGVDSVGMVQYLKIKYYNDKGAAFNDSVTTPVTIPSFPNIYDISTWTVDAYDVKTDKSPTTLMRAPGSMVVTGLVEHIMEHIAWTVKRDPSEVRLRNAEAGSPMPQYFAEVKSRADYDDRLARIREFNATNQWKKRGISLVPMKFPVQFKQKGGFHALVTIYSNDGTLVISHGGMELGQGINTKAAQVAAHVLGVPLEFVKVKASNNFVAPNDIFTASSTATDSVCYAVRQCCEELNRRLDAVRCPQLTWPRLIQQAYLRGVDLKASYLFVPERDLRDYPNYGVTVTEVEIDCLTGEHRIPRVDILQNMGKSLSPLVDIGQIEGAFLIGVGQYTSEQLIFDPDTGLLTTDRTWEYKVPGAKDIPEDWRLYFKKDPDTSPIGVYGSKSVAEAPLVMSVSVMFAIRRALESIRRDIGEPETFFNNDPPCSTEAVFQRSGISFEDFTL